MSATPVVRDCACVVQASGRSGMSRNMYIFTEVGNAHLNANVASRKVGYDNDTSVLASLLTFVFAPYRRMHMACGRLPQCYIPRSNHPGKFGI